MRWSLFSEKPTELKDRQVRGAERFLCDTMVCPIGQVLDVSATGIRVHCSEQTPLEPGEVIPLSLECNGQTLRVTGKVTRVKKKIFKPVEVAFQFVEMSPSQAAAVVQLARFGVCQTKAANFNTNTSSTSSKAGPTSNSGQSSGPNQRQQIAAGIEIEDLYEILGVSGTASQEQIRAAFRTLAKRYHPDTSTEPDATQQFSRITKAYSVLRDPKIRARYDAMLARSLAR